MTIESNLSKQEYFSNNSAYQFPFPFNVFDIKNLKIVITNTNVLPNETFEVEATLSNTTLSDSGGTFTYYLDEATQTPLPNGYIISLLRNMPFTQDMTLKNGQAFNSKEIENSFDIATAERQQLLEEIGRCLKVNETSQENPNETLEKVFAAEQTAIAQANKATEEAQKAKDFVDSGITDLEANRVQAITSIETKRDEVLVEVGGQVGIATTKASEASLSSQEAFQYRNEAEQFLATADINLEANKEAAIAEIEGEISKATIQADRATNEADRAKVEADRAASLAGIPSFFVGQKLALQALPNNINWAVADGGTIDFDDYPQLIEARDNNLIVHSDTYAPTNVGVWQRQSGNVYYTPNWVGKINESATVAGTVKEAGIPDIVGRIITKHCATETTHSTAFTPTGLSGAFRYGSPKVSSSSGIGGAGGAYNVSPADFRASYSSALYGKSTTVQPNTITTIPCLYLGQYTGA